MGQYIDADTHADECEDTWSFLPREEEKYAPRVIQFRDDDVPDWIANRSDFRRRASGLSRFWFIDGILVLRRIRDDIATGTTEDTRELRDIELRVKHMDELDVETQIVFPTMFLNEVTLRPEIEVALYKSYNRWLADRCAVSNGRLRWVAMIPFASMGDALEEMRWAKAHGAVGVFKRGVEGLDRAVSDPWFFPAYAQASDLNLPICLHQSNSYHPVSGRTTVTPWAHHQSFPVLTAFTQWINGKMPARFPRLRIGFIEASAAWTTHLLHFTGAAQRGETLASLNFYVTVEADEDIPYIARSTGGAESLIVGTDYSHTDRAALREAHQIVAERGDLDADEVRGLTSDNARSFYPL